MPVCATCHTDGQTAGSACRFCGAWVGGAAEGSGDEDRALPPNARAPLPSSASLEVGPPVDLPPLELELPPRRNSQASLPAILAAGTAHGDPQLAQKAAPAQAAPPPRSLKVPTSPDFDGDMGGAMLELDIQPTSPRKPPPSSGGLGMDSDAMMGNGAISSSNSLPSAPSSNDLMPPAISKGPSGKGRDALAGASEGFIEDEALSLAGYGVVPEKIWETPLYAYRVYKRQSELRHELETREDDYKGAKKEAEESVIALGNRGRVAAQKMPQYKAPLDAIASAEGLLRARDGQMMAAMDAHNKKLSDLDKRAQELETLLTNTLAEQRVLEGELLRAQEQVTRLDAQAEAMRKAQAAAQGGPPAGPGSISGAPKR